MTHVVFHLSPLNKKRPILVFFYFGCFLATIVHSYRKAAGAPAAANAGAISAPITPSATGTSIKISPFNFNYYLIWVPLLYHFNNFLYIFSWYFKTPSFEFFISLLYFYFFNILINKNTPSIKIPKARILIIIIFWFPAFLEQLLRMNMRLYLSEYLPC